MSASMNDGTGDEKMIPNPATLFRCGEVFGVDMGPVDGVPANFSVLVEFRERFYRRTSG